LATAGDFHAAVTYQQRAIALLQKDDPKRAEYRKTLERYEANKPYYKLGVLEEWGIRTAMRPAR
jgi:hypothetical protein